MTEEDLRKKAQEFARKESISGSYSPNFIREEVMFCCLSKGYLEGYKAGQREESRKRGQEDRMIQISKNWPRLKEEK